MSEHPYKPVDLIAEIDRLPAAERQAVEAEAEALRGKMRALRRLRGYARKSQAEVARALGVAQPSVSKMERQADMYLSTLRGYVESLGGRLVLRVELPDQPPIDLEDLRDLADRPDVEANDPDLADGGTDRA